MTFYKDFNKDVDDLLTKNYAVGEWKLESKFKGPKDTVFVNPQATGKGVTVDVEYNCSCGAKTKLSVAPDLTLKAKGSYDVNGHKFEATTDSAFSGFEVTYDGKLAGVSINEKLKQEKSGLSYDGGFSYAVAKHCEVGAGVKYTFNDSKLKWTAGARYVNAGRLISFQTAALSTWTTGITAPLTVADKKVTVGAKVDCGKGKCDALVGLEMGCILNPNATARFRISNQLEWALGYIVKFPNSWKAAISVDSSLKPGVTLTQE